MVSKVVLDHSPNPNSKLEDESIFIYLRQDAFKETIFKGQKSFLLIIAQIISAYFILYLIGMIFTYHINTNKFLSDAIKRLYLVKGTSLSKNKTKYTPT